MNKYRIKYYLKPNTCITIESENKRKIKTIQEQYDKAINTFTTIIEPVGDKKTTIIKTSEIICVEIEKI